MATETGVWDLQEVRDKQLAGEWEYTNAGELYITGNDPWQSGTTGQNDRVNRSSPIQIPGKWALEDSIFASANKLNGREKNVMAMKNDGTLWGWGDSDKGQRGDNNIAQRSSPTQVSGTTWNVLNLAGTNCRSTLCTKTDNTLWVWGDNNYGQLGQNNTTLRSSPVQLPGTTWKATINDGYKSMAFKTDGTLWTWGRNQYGGLGHNDTSNESSPKQVGTDTTWGNSFGSHDDVAVVVKTNGTLWAWGYNNVGQLGQNNKTTYSSPKQIGTDTTWNKVCPGTQNGICTLKTDGTLWAWGSNAYGSLGQNSTTQYSSPIQIGTDTTWDNITGNFYHMAGHKTDGTLWVWGEGNRGQLGQNNVIARSSPTQIPGTWENTFKAGGYVTVALKN